MLEVLGQVPGHVGAVADDAVGGLRPDHPDLDPGREVGQIGARDLRLLGEAHQTATGALIPGWGS